MLELLRELDPVALVVGWLAIIGFVLWGISVVWWMAGELAWRHVVPSRFKAVCLVVAHGTIYQTPFGWAAMRLLGGPFGLRRRSKVISYKRLRKVRIEEAESLKRIEAAEAASRERKANG
jgi:hypothetical protein